MALPTNKRKPSIRARHLQLSKLQTKYLAARVKKLRSLSKRKQDEVGWLIGKDQTFMAKAEAGKRTLDFATVEQLATALSLDLSAFSTISAIEKEHPQLKITPEEVSWFFVLDKYRKIKKRAPKKKIICSNVGSSQSPSSESAA